LLKKLYHRLNQRLWSHMVIINTLMQSTLWIQCSPDFRIFLQLSENTYL
jgi:hypothetical protein